MSRSNRSLLLIAAVCSFVSAPPPVRAEVVGVDIKTQTDAWNGVAFGDVGAYEYLAGRIRFAVDPDNPRNRIIAGLDPLRSHAGAAQAQGPAPPPSVGSDGNKVRFYADFQILRPKDPSKGNGTLLLDVVNRGMKTVESFRRAVPGGDESVAPGGDDGFLMRRGFTIVWVGWEFDLRTPSIGMRIVVPRARGARCTVRSAVSLASETTASFEDLSGYASDAAVNVSLSVRDGPLGEPTPLARGYYKLEKFNFVTLQHGFMFTAGRTYELSYDVVDPPVGGLGFAAVRDAVSWLKFAPDSNVKVQRTLAFGSSQSGRFLRTFLYLGFNADERGRQVFDGVIAHIAGASRLDLNRLCAKPTSLGQFDATSFPFADAALRDPVTGVEEGALENPRARDSKPKIFYTNTGVEYWGGARSAALIHTTPDGEHDLTLPDNERVYFLTGSQHGPARFPPDAPGFGAQRENPTDYWLTMRALLVAMQEWLRDGKAPPPSRYPRLQDKTLVRSADVAFPSLPGVGAPQSLPVGSRAANALLAQDGAPGSPLPYLVPQTDGDGIELAGIRLPDIEVPLATYTGWNLRNESIGGASQSQLYPLLGSYIPFPATAAARAATKDPRAAIAERYASKQAYLDKARAAGEKLVADRLLLAEDLPSVLERAGAHWDLLTK